MSSEILGASARARAVSAALAVLAGGLGLAGSSQAATTITSLVYFHDAVPNCEDTVDGSTCAPVGVTRAGALDNAFLNDTTTKAIDLGYGDYYTFGNPWAGTDFMIPGDAITAQLTLSDGKTLTQTTVVPDLSVAGATVFDFASAGIVIKTTGVTTADRMSFGAPPTAFAPDGRDDYALQLSYVPEPAAWVLMLAGFGGLGASLRRRRAGGPGAVSATA